MKNSGRSLNHTQAIALFLILTVTLHVLGLRVNGFIKGSDLISDYTYGSKILAVILAAEMVLLIYFTPVKYNRQALRCSIKESWRSLTQSAVISFLIVASLVGFRVYLNARDPACREIPPFGLYLNVHTRWLYPFNIVFQEFFIKAFTQENIGIMLRSIGASEKHNEPDKIQSFLTVFITAMFFFILHIQYPLYYMTGAFVLCFVTGLLYERDRNIWGPVMIHFAIGFLPRCLGILQIIEG